MSLIRVRRERKELNMARPGRPPKLWRLVLGLVFVLLLLYYLSRAF